MKNIFPILFIVLSLLTSKNSFGQKNPDLAKTPPMGWNSWNWFGKQDINEKIIYEVVIDGGWRDVKLSPEGKLLPHPVKFPNGIKPLADYAHSKGLKFGLHAVPGTHDCGNDKVGGFNMEELHIKSDGERYYPV